MAVLAIAATAVTTLPVVSPNVASTAHVHRIATADAIVALLFFIRRPKVNGEDSWRRTHHACHLRGDVQVMGVVTVSQAPRAGCRQDEWGTKVPTPRRPRHDGRGVTSCTGSRPALGTTAWLAVAALGVALVGFTPSSCPPCCAVAGGLRCRHSTTVANAVGTTSGWRCQRRSAIGEATWDA